MILALMNYERTVADFGKCDQSVRMMFGVPYVGNCIRNRDETVSHSALFPPLLQY